MRSRTLPGWLRRSAPATVALPPLGGRRVASILSVVVLPAPLGPRNPKISPALTVRSTPFTASTVCLRDLKVRVRPRVSIMFVLANSSLLIVMRTLGLEPAGPPATGRGGERTFEVVDRYLALPEGEGPFPGVVVIHEIYGLNRDIREICDRFAAEGYAALGVDLFAGRNRVVCMARFMADMLRGVVERYGIGDLRDAPTFRAAPPDVAASPGGAIGFRLGGRSAL